MKYSDLISYVIFGQTSNPPTYIDCDHIVVGN